jgi:hypothetical protein
MWDPTPRTHLTYKAREVIVDKPDDGCIAETCSLYLLTSIHIVVLDCIFHHITVAKLQLDHCDVTTY